MFGGALDVREEECCPICKAGGVDTFVRELTGESASRCLLCGYATVPRENAWGVNEELRPFLKWAPPGKKPAWWPEVPWQPEGGFYTVPGGTECEIRPNVIGRRLLWLRRDRKDEAGLGAPQAVYESIDAAIKLTNREHLCIATIQNNPPAFKLLF